jgi:hypothetical protein
MQYGGFYVEMSNFLYFFAYCCLTGFYQQNQVTLTLFQRLLAGAKGITQRRLPRKRSEGFSHAVIGLYINLLRLNLPVPIRSFRRGCVFMYNFPLSIPSLVAQQEIIANIEAERKIIDSCQELMVKYGERIKKIVDGVWGRIKA